MKPTFSVIVLATTFKQMRRPPLEERFKPVTHKDTKPLLTYVLTWFRAGPWRILEKQKRTLPVVVIDHIGPKPTDN